MMVKPANPAITGPYWNKPVRIKNSPGKPFVRGKATLPKRIIMKNMANKGLTFAMPPNDEIDLVFVLLSMMSTKKNKPTALMP